jgi:hypothetical protein
MRFFSHENSEETLEKSGRAFFRFLPVCDAVKFDTLTIDI